MDNKLILIDQKNLTITGIKNVIAVSNSNISLNLDSSALQILGEGMEVKKLDVESGLLEVEGKITSIKYMNSKEKIGFFKRIFK
jgi:sporulation protein YabP